MHLPAPKPGGNLLDLLKVRTEWLRFRVIVEETNAVMTRQGQRQQRQPGDHRRDFTSEGPFGLCRARTRRCER